MLKLGLLKEVDAIPFIFLAGTSLLIEIALANQRQLLLSTKCLTKALELDPVNENALRYLDRVKVFELL